MCTMAPLSLVETESQRDRLAILKPPFKLNYSLHFEDFFIYILCERERWVSDRNSVLQHTWVLGTTKPERWVNSGDQDDKACAPQSAGELQGPGPRSVGQQSPASQLPLPHSEF